MYIYSHFDFADTCFGVFPRSENDECALQPEPDAYFVLQRCPRKYNT